MPFQIGSVAVHDDGQHTGSAKRNTANGVAALNVTGDIFAPGGLLALTRGGTNDIQLYELTASELAQRWRRMGANNFEAYLNESGGQSRIQTASMKDAASGIAGLDALKALNAHRLRGLMGGFGSNYTQVSGTWISAANASQTDYDDILPAAGQQVVTNSSTDLEEIKWPSVVLNAGTYAIKVIVITGPTKGILELLHGATSLGTFDCYAAGVAYNQVASFAYSPATRVSADFRLRANGKNGASSAYSITVSRIEIFKTA